MAPSTPPPPSPEPSSGGKRQRYRYRYRLPSQKKKKPATDFSSNWRTLLLVGLLAVALLATIAIIASHLTPEPPLE